MMRVVALTCLLQAVAADPLSQVVGILERESGELKSEDKKENAWFAETMDTLQEQEIRLKNARERSAEKINQANAAAAEANGVIEAATGTIEESVAQQSDETKTMNDAADECSARKSEMNQTVRDCQDTISVMRRALRAIKKGMGQGFLQGTFKYAINEVINTLQPLMDAQSVEFATKKQLNALIQASQDSTLEAPQGSSENYQNQSGGIVSILDDMIEKAEAKLEELNKDVMEHTFFCQNARMDSENKIKSLKQKENTAKADMAEAKENLGGANADKAAAEKALADAGTEFKAVVKEERVDEKDHGTFQEDNETTQSGVQGGLQALAKTSLVQENVSFLQESPVREQVATMLRTLAKKYRSVPIAQIAIRAKADPFAKVKGLIRELVKKLKSAKAKDAAEHGQCQKEKKENNAKLDKLSAEIEKNSGRLASAQAKVARNQKLAKDLQADMEKSQADLAKKTELHASAKGDNNKMIGNAKNNISAMESALDEIPASAEVPRKIIGDLKADLEKKRADAEESIRKGDENLSDATQEAKVSRASNEAQVKGAQQQVANSASRIQDLQSDLDDLNETKNTELKVEANRAKRCAPKQMSFEERAARRQAEIDGLKTALKILTEDVA